MTMVFFFKLQDPTPQQLKDALKKLAKERHNLFIKSAFTSLSLNRIHQRTLIMKRVVFALAENKSGSRKVGRAARLAAAKREAAAQSQKM